MLGYILESDITQPRYIVIFEYNFGFRLTIREYSYVDMIYLCRKYICKQHKKVPEASIDIAALKSDFTYSRANKKLNINTFSVIR